MATLKDLGDRVRALWNTPVRVETGGFWDKVANFRQDVRKPVNQFLSTPISQQYQPVAQRAVQASQQFRQSPIGQFGAGIVHGANFGLTKSPAPAPQTPTQSAAFIGGNIASSLFPSTIAGTTYRAFNKATNPIIARAIGKTAGPISSRIAAGVGNVAQGNVITAGTQGRLQSPLENLTDLAMGVVGGKGMFDTPNVAGLTRLETGLKPRVEISEQSSTMFNNYYNKIKGGGKIDIRKDKNAADFADLVMTTAKKYDSKRDWKWNDALELTRKLVGENIEYRYRQAGGRVNKIPGMGLVDNKKGLTPEVSTKGTVPNPIKITGKSQRGQLGLNKQTPVLQRSASEPIIPTYKRLAEETKIVDQAKLENEMAAKSAQLQRLPIMSKRVLDDINLFKRLAGRNKFESGTIDEFQKAYPKTVDNTTEAVRELGGPYAELGDEEAFNLAMRMPAQSKTRVKRADTSKLKLLTREQILEQRQFEKDFGKPATIAQQKRDFDEWDRAVSEYTQGITRNGGAVSVEPTAKTSKKITLKTETGKVKEQEAQYRAWQKQVFGEEGTRTVNKAVDDLSKLIKTTNDQNVIRNADNWKDKPMVMLSRETMERNFEDIMGGDAPEMKRKILEPIFRANADRVKFLQKERGEIASLGIKPRSKESAILQEFGEGKITANDVRNSGVDADKIFNAEKVLRQKYDRYLTQINTVLVKNGYDPIPKRKDYFHHFQDLTDAFEQIGVAIKAEDLPTDINGLTADFKPGKTFFTAALRRTGDKTSVDAITGIDRYLEGASNQIFHTDNIQRLRALDKAIREKYAGTNHLTNFAANLTEYTNALAGKKAMLDRAVESVVGRKLYAGANALRRQTGANMVGANISSALTNSIPITQTLATTNKQSVLQAALNTIRNVYKDDGFIDKSNFLKSRFGADRLSKTNWEKIGEKGNWMFKMMDMFTAQLAVRSKYLEGIKRGLNEVDAMRKADEWGRKTLAGRSAGEVPTLFNSKTLGFLTQFQLEVNNQMSFMGKDIPRNFDKVGAASALGQLFLYSYIFNSLYEKAIGRRPAFDPIGVAQQAYEDYTNPDMKEGQASKNLVRNVSQQLPFTSILEGGRIPVGSAIPNLVGIAKGETTVGKELTKPLFYLLPPTGGGQLKKTVEGLGAYNKGASITQGGNVRYPIPQTGANLARTGLFGQYSTPEARQYFREGRTPLGEKQTEAFFQSENPAGFYGDVMSARKETAIKAGMKPGDTKETKSGKYMYVDGDEVKTIDTSKVSSMPSGTGLEKAKKEQEAYKLVDDILESPLTDDKKAEAISKLGISSEDAGYYLIANDTTRVKTAFVKENVSDMDINKLASLRKEVNGSAILSDSVIDELYAEELITKDERKRLKAIKDVNGKLKDTTSATKPKKITIPTIKIETPKFTKSNIKVSAPKLRVGKKRAKSKKYAVKSIKLSGKTYPAIKIKPYRNTLA